MLECGYMEQVPPPLRRWTRRALLGSAIGPAVWGAKGEESPGAAKRFLDAATEFEILRVTGLEHDAWLPLASLRAFTRRGEALLFASNAGGTPQLFRHDFKANRVRQLSDAAALNTNSFGWTTADRNFIYIDGRKVLLGGSARDRLVHELPEDWAQTPRIALSDDSTVVAVSSSNGTKTRVIVVSGRTSVFAEERAGDIGTFYMRPRRSALSFLADGSLWYLPLSTRQVARLQTAPGEVLSSQWTSDGALLLYLLKPAAAGRLTEIREFSPETGADTFIAKTSQFAHFQRNGDATVFLGASSSQASPHLMVLLRSVKRELTICEHRCSDARLSRAVFSPNSGRVAFQTDRHGKLVIYSMAVDRLIEETDDHT